MIKKIGVLVLTIISTSAFSQTNSLYKIVKQKKYGFVDAIGSVLIEPKFNGARQFKEGLAAVREKDKYGYVNENGNYVITPHYEMAESFNNGLAVVYLKGKPFVINKKNEKVIDTIYKEIEDFQNGYANVSPKDYFWGVVDSTGKVIIKPELSSKINSFDDDYAIITKPNQNMLDLKYAVINKKYQIVLPFGLYSYIQYLGNDLFFVNPKDGGGLIINKLGKVFFKDDNNFNYSINSRFNDGLAIIRITEKPNTNQEFTYSAIADTNGNIIFKDTVVYGGTTRFHTNYAFAQLNDNLFWAINKKGKKHFIDSIKTIDEIIQNNCFIYQHTNERFGLLDSNANIIIKPIFSWMGFDDKINKFYFIEDVNDTISKNGYCDSKGNIEYIDNRLSNLWGFVSNGYVYLETNDTVALYNNKYKMVWQNILSTDSIKTLNIDFKYSTRYIQKEFYDKKLNPNFYYFGDTIKHFSFNNEKSKLGFKIQTNITDTFINSFYSHPVYLFNNTNKDLTYLSIDFEAPIVLQAKNEKSSWEDIATIRQYMGHNTNTYMKSILRPNSYLKFPIPIFEGSFKTKLRVVFEYNIRDDKKYYYQWKTKKLYSNEMDVSINPAQFYYKNDFPTDNRLGTIFQSFLLQ